MHINALRLLLLICAVVILVVVTMLVAGGSCLDREAVSVDSILLACGAMLVTLQLCRKYAAASQRYGGDEHEYYERFVTGGGPTSTSTAPPTTTSTSTQSSNNASSTTVGTLPTAGNGTIADILLKVSASGGTTATSATTPKVTSLATPLPTSSTITSTTPTASASATASASTQGPAATSTALTVQTDEVLKPATLLPGLTMYTSCFSSASYPGPSAGRNWRSIAPALPGTSLTCANGAVRNLDLQFKVTPSFSSREGFALGTNTLTGPLSYTLGINGDMACSIFTVCQWNADIASDAEVSVFKLYANTANNNGLSLVLKPGDPTPNMISMQAYVKVGKSISQQCKMNDSPNILVVPRTPYILTVVKDYGHLMVFLTNLSSVDFNTITLLDFSAGAVEPLVFSNTDMTINETANWSANMMAFACFSRALTDNDRTSWFAHYKENLRRFDANYMAMVSDLQAAQRLRSCPFDGPTCSACAATKDWSNMSSIIAAGPSCLKAIDIYCTANPTAPRCECWKMNDPSYTTAACKALRDLFSGQPTQQKCPVQPAPSTSVYPPRSSQQHGENKVATGAHTTSQQVDTLQLLKSVVTPANIVAIGKAISEIQGTSSSSSASSSKCKGRCHSQARSSCGGGGGGGGVYIPRHRRGAAKDDKDDGDDDDEHEHEHAGAVADHWRTKGLSNATMSVRALQAEPDPLVTQQHHRDKRVSSAWSWPWSSSSSSETETSKKDHHPHPHPHPHPKEGARDKIMDEVDDVKDAVKTSAKSGFWSWLFGDESK
jgi:hypothetical protein